MVLAGEGAGGKGEGFEKFMLGEDARDLGPVGHDEARTLLASDNGHEPWPARTAAPQGRRAPIQHHGGSVTRAFEIDRLEILLLIEAQSVEDVAGKDHEARSGGAECHGLALQVRDGVRGAVGAYHEHTGVEYIAVMILRSAAGRPTPLSVS